MWHSQEPEKQPWAWALPLQCPLLPLSPRCGLPHTFVSPEQIACFSLCQDQVQWSILSCFLCLHRVSSHWLYSLNPIIPLMQGKVGADGYKKERRDERKGGHQVWTWRCLTFKSNDSCGSPLVPCFCRTFPMLFPAAAATVNATASHILFTGLFLLLTAPKISVANQVSWVSPVTTDPLQSQLCFGN